MSHSFDLFENGKYLLAIAFNTFEANKTLEIDGI
jgi:hypothetical protein